VDGRIATPLGVLIQADSKGGKYVTGKMKHQKCPGLKMLFV